MIVVADASPLNYLIQIQCDILLPKLFGKVLVPAAVIVDLLHPGEREGIQLAQELHADLLLIDDRRGRLEAKRRAIPTTGTLGVLLEAQKRGLMDAETAFQQLIDETSFRATPAVR